MNKRLIPILWIATLWFFVSGVRGGNASDKITSLPIFSPQLLENTEEIDWLVATFRREAIESPDLRSASEALSKIMKFYDNVQGVGGAYGLKWGNKEIKEAVVDVLLVEYERHNDRSKALIDTAEPLQGQNFTTLSLEGYTEYIEFLISVADSTLSPRIYEYRLFPPTNMAGGGLRFEYLARVNPARTLETILGAKPGTVPAGKGNPEYLYASNAPENRNILLTRRDAFRIVERMRKTAPDLIRETRDQVRGFLKQNVFFYRDGLPDRFKGSPRQLYADFDMRNCALNLYEFFCDPADIAEIRRLATDPPIIDELTATDALLGRNEQIGPKSRRILETIH